MKHLVKVAALFVKDGKLLVVKSKNRPIFFALGGTLEQDEDIEACLRREVMEEVSCEVSHFEYLGSFTDLTWDNSRLLTMICFKVDLQGTPTPANEIESVGWVSRALEIPVSGFLTTYIFPMLKM